MRLWIVLLLAGCQADGGAGQDARPDDARVTDGSADAARSRDVGAGSVDRGRDPIVDAAIDATVDADVDAGPQPTCPAPDVYTLSTNEVCSTLDIFDPSTCTPAAQHATCQQLYPCDPPFEDPGAMVRCCDGETWRWVDEEPDLCGFPPQEPEAP